MGLKRDGRDEFTSIVMGWNQWLWLRLGEVNHVQTASLGAKRTSDVRSYVMLRSAGATPMVLCI